MSVENYHLLEIYSRDITKVFYVSTPISDMELITRPTRTSIVIEFDIKQGGLYTTTLGDVFHSPNQKQITGSISFVKNTEYKEQASLFFRNEETYRFFITIPINEQEFSRLIDFDNKTQELEIYMETESDFGEKKNENVITHCRYSIRQLINSTPISDDVDVRDYTENAIESYRQKQTFLDLSKDVKTLKTILLILLINWISERFFG